MKLLLTGSSGLVGTALQPFLKEKGYSITRLVRKGKQQENTILWDPENQSIDRNKLEGFEVVIHLAGESIAEKRWSAVRKQQIRDSRILSTQLLSSTLAALQSPPKVFIAASAIGYYGDQQDKECTEDSEAGKGFLSEVCQEWEAATRSAAAAGIRTTNLRFGIILSPDGGALKKMLLPFKLGAGGVLGPGEQFMSWIAIQDVLGAIFYVIKTPSLSGPLNVVSPHPVTNRMFSKTLGHVLHRPVFMAIPAWSLRMIFGKEMADECLLSSTRAIPQKLMESGYPFLYPHVAEALKRQCH